MLSFFLPSDNLLSTLLARLEDNQSTFLTFGDAFPYNNLSEPLDPWSIDVLIHAIKNHVNESFPFSISHTWKGSGSEAQDISPDNKQSTLVFPKGNPIPSVKVLTFFRTGTFSIDVQCHDLSDLPTKISTYTIGPFKTENGEKGKVKVRVRLNLHGIVSVDSATLNYNSRRRVTHKVSSQMVNRAPFVKRSRRTLALLIGLEQYGVHPLVGGSLDAKFFRCVLKDCFGFKDEEVNTMVDYAGESQMHTAEDICKLIIFS